MRAVLIAVAGVLLLLALGHRSGNQPERDATAAASAELGIPFRDHFVDVGELTLHVVTAGPEEGPPVILLHGFPEFWYAWRGPAAVLARAGFRVILPDQRGYNLSDAELMIHLMASIPNGLVIEDMGLLDDLWVDWPRPVNGIMTAPETPGHGLKIKAEIMRDCALA